MRAHGRVHERALFVSPRIPSELELQARWFAGEFGRSFTSTRGNKIDIVQFGTWNREAGPDFSDAAISVNGGDPIGGSIEIDLLDRNWELHGHATNPAFDQTALHVFVESSSREFFTRTKSNRNVPQVQLDLSVLPSAFNPNLPLARPGRCQAPLKNLPEDRVRGILDAAAQFRLQQKCNRIRRKIDIGQSNASGARTSDHGADEALFQEIAATLGYKENKLPFTLLAQRLSLKFLRDHSADAEALLFGMAGFLQAPDLDVYKKSTRKYVRNLWDRWWPHRDDLQRLILPMKTWRLSGSRPANHPQRRLAALAALVMNWSTFMKLAKRKDSEPLGDFLFGLQHSFWNFHYTLTADPSPKQMALIGESRVAEILANVYYPFALSEGHEVWSEFSKLPARLTNRRLATGATRLFGDDPRGPVFLKTVAHQQGLLQIYEDFCLRDNSDCAQCPFPEQMKNW